MPQAIDIPSSELRLMVYDGACRFCRATIERRRDATSQQIHFSPCQDFSAPFPKVGSIDFQRALHFNAFSKAPPRYIRIVLYQYRFTNTTERRKTGNWWHREQIWVAPGWLPVN
jgi:Lipase maturation factor